MQKFKNAVQKIKTVVLTAFFILLVCVAYILEKYRAQEQSAAEKPTVMTQEETKDIRALQNQLDISHTNAAALEKRITAIQTGSAYYV